MEKGFKSDTGFTYCENVRFWSQNKDLFEYNKVFALIHIVNRRFILAVIFICEKRIQIFEKVQSDTGEKYLIILFRYIKAEYYLKDGNTLPNIANWNLNPTRPLLPSYTDNGTFNFCNRYILSQV